MTWFFAALAGYALLAGVQLTDRFLLTRAIPNPFTYAFFIGVLGAITVALAPFAYLTEGLVVPSIPVLVLALSSGAVFIAAVIFFYSALRAAEATVVIPFIGSIVPLATFFLAFFIVGERLGEREILGSVFLVGGGFLLAARITRGATSFPWRGFLLASCAAILFALQWALRKEAFAHLPFFHTVIIASFGGFLAALLILASSRVRREVIASRSSVARGSKVLLVANNIFGSASGLLLNYAVALGSVTVVQALQGIEYVFLLGFALLLSWRFPRTLEERVKGWMLVQKIAGIAVIGIGLVFIAQR